MRTRKKDQRNLVKVGVFITALTAVVMFMVLSIGKENSIFEPKIELKARVANVTNLKPGSYVELKGIRVGNVSEIKIISEDEVEINMTILEKDLKWIKQDSKVSISTAGLVGDKFVEIYNGSKSAPVINPEKEVLVSEDLADLKKIISKGDTIATITERILAKLDHILYNLGDGRTIIETVNSMNKAASNLQKITSELHAANMGKMVTGINGSMDRLNKSTATLDKILTRVDQGPGSAHSLIYDDSLHEDLRVLLGGAQRNKVIKYFIRESIKNSEQKK
jgi:phospholipid/cholesterol/gamma-HCH transport system substrate-binding protein